MSFSTIFFGLCLAYAVVIVTAEFCAMVDYFYFKRGRK